MARLSLAQIEDSFDAQVLKRGQDYVHAGRVIEVDMTEDGVLKATVQGSLFDTYSVRLILRDSKTPRIEGHCTCPVESQCKHCAAAALVWHERLRADLGTGPENSPLPGYVEDWLGIVAAGDPNPGEIIEGTKNRVFYILELAPTRYQSLRTHVRAISRSLLKSGDFGAATDVKASSIDNRQFAKYFNAFDRQLLVDLSRNAAREDWSKADFQLDPTHGERLLRRVLQSGRCFWKGPVGAPLLAGPPRRGTLTWVTDRKGQQSPSIATEGGGITLPLSPPWYVDTVTGECGPIECGLDPKTAYALLTSPSIAPEHANAVRRRLAAVGVPPTAVPNEPIPVETVAITPTPHLAIDVLMCGPSAYDYWRRARRRMIPIPFARLTFLYGETRVVPSDKGEIRIALGDRIRIIPRDIPLEIHSERLLWDKGWTSCQRLYFVEVPSGRGTWMGMGPAESGDTSYLEAFRRFIEVEAPKLREAGWIVEASNDFKVVAEEEIEWSLGVEGLEDQDWFEFKLGVRIDGREVPLRPILLQLLDSERTPLTPRTGKGNATQSSEKIRHITLDGGLIISLSPDRVRKLLQPLLELFGPVSAWPDELKMEKARLAETEAVADAAERAGVEWKTAPELRVLAKRLKDFDHLTPVHEPAGFNAVLRDYQREGLAWLQFLREYGFSGILADDMGLGKTVQVLAHIQMEKLAGRLTRPCLVVAPTSTLPNWRREAERFAPDLSVHVHHGLKRKENTANLDSFDLIVTNYALLARDRSELLQHPFHFVVLDEAQNVKNAATAAAKVASELTATHRICLSGTPIENHLDELWSLFRFLMPGFLGTAAKFRQEYRVPIEQKGDEIARARLSRIIRPFMLRRTKSEVVKELPPKTEILETIEMGDSQRELYETIRLAMDERVRGLLAEQGLAKSRIQVLDALLKLRQVCCDPRLVKIPAAKAVSESAKLDRLAEMLAVLIEDGRKVLLFSQFTSMLDLIEARVRDLGIEWVRITGDTKDRETPVRRFEAGEVPLFLISLKAGGTGLNLVAADTVIHYDPWWNPAVENQATDRAYRIGQDKPVMVYKLVVAGTVEEKILELQKRKGDLAASVLSATDRTESILDKGDLEWLFAQ